MRMSDMRIARPYLLLPAALVVLCAVSSCKTLVKEAFKTPAVRVVDVTLAVNPVFAPKGPWDFTLILAVDNPNDYPLNVASVSCTAVIGRRTVAEAEHSEEILIGPSGTTKAAVPLRLRPEGFAEALREVLHDKSLSYEFNGSVGLRAPVAGVIRIPFSRAGRIDPSTLLKKKGIVFN
jgi:LEA14-like dessication related protein